MAPGAAAKILSGGYDIYISFKSIAVFYDSFGQTAIAGIERCHSSHMSSSRLSQNPVTINA